DARDDDDHRRASQRRVADRVGEMRAHVDGADASQAKRVQVDVVKAAVQAAPRTAGRVELGGMEVACRGVGPEPAPPLAFLRVASDPTGVVEETGDNGRVERGGPDRWGMSRQDLKRGGG